MNQTLLMVLFISFFVFLLWLGVFVSVLFLKHTGVITSTLVSRVINTTAVAIPLLMGLSMFLGRTAWHPLNAVLYTVTSTWIVIVAGLFFASVLGWLILGVLNLSGAGFPRMYLGVIVLAVSIIYPLYGVINASILRTKTVEVNLNQVEVLSGMRIALVSDLHVGLVRGKNFVQRVVDRIMKENPDMIIIAGDLIDGPHFPYQEFLAPLSGLSAPQGVYFTPGNHETYNDELEEVYKAIPENVTILSDEIQTIPGTDITIAGFEYDTESREHFAERAVRVAAGSSPAIGILHDPKHRDSLSELGINLVVSGHTHGGQFFPGTAIVRMIYGSQTNGLVTHDSGAYYTTTGAGTAVSPARVGTQAEVVILEVQ
jgi:predicted MPP superfamily phosphohydrolase